MGIERGAEVKSVVELGWHIPAPAGNLVVIGTYGSHTCRFILTGLPEHRQLVRYDKEGRAATARPATREEDWLFIAIHNLWFTGRQARADAEQAYKQIDVQESLLKSTQSQHDDWYEQLAEQAGQIDRLLQRPTIEAYGALQAEVVQAAKDVGALKAECLELEESNDRLREGIRALQDKLAKCELEKTQMITRQIEGQL